MTPRFQFWWFVYIIGLTIFAVFAYGLTTPNLVLSNWTPFWEFQTWMWRTFFNHRDTLSYTYVGLVSALFLMYAAIIKASADPKLLKNVNSPLRFLGYFVLALLPLWVGYNALSTDIFNYIFNAKIIAVYQSSPYLKVAMDFPDDPWMRFMHNIHTPSPYGWGWTIMTVVLYYLGLSKFLLTWLIFKGAATLSLLLFAGLGWWAWHKKYLTSWPVLVAIITNPLVLLEYGLNGHNDLWMMVPALASLLLIHKPLSRKTWWLAILSSLLLGFSISIKVATLALLPLWVGLLVIHVLKPHKYLEVVKSSWPLAAWVLMFLPLLTARSQYFHPWYLGWVLVWVPFFPFNSQKSLLRLASQVLLVMSITFSLTSLMRYLPWLWNNGYSDLIIAQQRAITWSAIPLGLLCFLGLKLCASRRAIKR